MNTILTKVEPLSYQHWRWEVRTIHWLDFGESQSMKDAYADAREAELRCMRAQVSGDPSAGSHVPGARA